MFEILVFLYLLIGAINLLVQTWSRSKPFTFREKVFKHIFWPFDWTKKSKGSFQRYYKKTSLNRYMKEFKIK